MIQIIEKGDNTPDKWEVRCSKCRTKFTYEREDIKSDQREGDYVNCPLCKSYINHSESKKVKGWSAEDFYNK